MADPEQTPRLRPAHVLASSLAAVTGAFLASRLGVYGTVIGVGVISLFSTIGTDIYVRSLDRTRQMAARSRIRTIESPASDPAARTAELPRAAETAELPLVAADVSHRSETAGPAITTRPAADDQPTVAFAGMPADADRAGGETGTMVPADGHVDADGEEREAVDPVLGRWTPARISLIVAGALAAFVLAFLVITGIEYVSGSSLSGGGRTTLGELGGSGGSDPGSETDEVDAPGQPGPTPESDRPSQSPTDPPEGDDRDVPIPPAEELPDPEVPVEPETPSPTESPTSEPTEPPTDEDAGTLGIPDEPGT